MAIVELKIKSTPYTYILEWTKYNKRYIGARWAAGCHPDDLWNKYFTSSQYVHDFVRQYGSPDIILIDKVFSTAKKAMEREQELQKKFDVRHNETFLNKAIAGIFDFSDPQIRKKMSDAKKGKKHTLEWIEWVTEFHRTRKRSPETYTKISKALTGKKLSPEHCQKIGKLKIGNKNRLGLLHTEKTKEIIRSKKLGQKHSEETKKRMEATHRARNVEVFTCPHCNKSGRGTAMFQYHFNNCKKAYKS